MLSLRVGLALSVLLLARAALACSPAEPTVHELDPVEMTEDDTPPTAVTVEVADIERGKGPVQEGCGSSGTSCDDMGTITLSLTGATDDRTAVEQLGYAFSVAEGDAPDFYFVRGDAVRAPSGTHYLSWHDGDTDDQESLSFTLRVVPIDRAGNEGPGTLVEVRHAGSGDCAFGAAGRWFHVLPLLLGIGALFGLRAFSRRHHPGGARPAHAA